MIDAWLTPGKVTARCETMRNRSRLGVDEGGVVYAIDLEQWIQNKARITTFKNSARCLCHAQHKYLMYFITKHLFASVRCFSRKINACLAIGFDILYFIIWYLATFTVLFAIQCESNSFFLFACLLHLISTEMKMFMWYIIIILFLLLW